MAIGCRQRAVLAFLDGEHRRGRPGVPCAEVLRATGVPWSVLDSLMVPGMVHVNRAGLCLPDYVEPCVVSGNVVPLRVAA
jgi:hypothetical protein